MNENHTGIAFQVEGWPPAKSEAASLLGAGHSHSDRVRLLLACAGEAVSRTGWTAVTTDVALDLVVRGPSRPPSDATNLLGGVGDVLQNKTVASRNLDVAQLGGLADVALYHDDRQIRRISYREEHAASAHYSVDIRLLRTSASLATGQMAPNASSEPESATERGRRVVNALTAKGLDLGFTVHHEYPVQGGRLDVVWLLPILGQLPGATDALPVVGFEIESSWRTRKHLKGDYLNLYDLAAALGVLVLLGEGPEIDSTRRFAQTLVDRPGPRILVWSEHDVQRLTDGQTDAGLATLAEVVRDPSAQAAEQQHAGKFRPLWSWLRNQTEHQLPMTFGEIEEVIGIPLPPSCRKHPPHWYSYEGSAIARAIQDAGWTASQVDIRKERLVLSRR